VDHFSGGTPVESSDRPRLGLNVVANYLGKLWGIVSIYAFVPVYVRFLGIDAYGLIAFNAIALALLFIADAGLSAAFAREAAKAQHGQDLLDLLTSIERVLFSILIVVSAIFMLAVPIIGSHWLTSTGTVSEVQVRQCLWLMGIALVPQIAMSLYFGGLMGLQRQVSANLLWTGFSIARSGFVIIPIYFVPDIRAFFIWQAFVSIAMLLIMRAVLRNQIITPIKDTSPYKIRGNFSWPALRAIRSYAAGMLGISIIAALNTQLDKLVVSRMLPLNEFAQYSLASTLAQVPYILTLPIAAALLPRLTSLLHRDEQRGQLITLYRNASYYMASVGAVSGLGLSLFMPDIFSLWMHGESIGGDTVQAASLLAVGSTFLTLQLAPFQLSLANGHQTTNLRLGVVMLLVSVPLLVLLTQKYGVLGAAIPWLLLNLVAFAYLSIALNKRFPLVSLSKWFFEDNALPVFFAFFWLLIARSFADLLQLGSIFNCFIAATGALAAIGSSYGWRRKGAFMKLLSLRKQ
jgi:O-antigen/teichoic acid export membrane protein